MGVLSSYSRYGVPRALRSLRQNWRASANNVLILAASLAVLGMVALLYINVVHFSHAWLSNTTISLFLNSGLNAQQRQALLDRVRLHPQVRRATLVSPQEGLKELADRLGADRSLLAGAGQAGLPYTIDFDVYYDYRSRIDKLASAFKALPGVDDVVYTERMLARVELFFQLIKGIGLFFIALILVSFYLIVSHATELSLHARREEIVLLSLVGATRAFVRASFVVEGMLISLMGSLLALAIVWFCHQLLIAGLSWNAITRSIKDQSVFFPLGELGVVLALALVLGAISSHRAVTRQLKSLEP